MAKTLIIAEKPSVGQDYAKALGGGFQKHEGYLESDDRIVSWAVGHLVTLADPEDYDSKWKRWSMRTLPILPERFALKPDETGKRQLDVLRRLLKRKDVERVVNGCDAGREGELIFAYIYDLAGADKPVDRLWVSSMTRDAIRAGFDSLRDGDALAGLEAAARSRSEADWLVGINGTRAATLSGRIDGTVSLGRVQTPTLALIVRRDLEIDAFQPETYFQIDARFRLAADRTYTGRWFEGRTDRTPERERADAVASAAGGAAATVETVKRTERRTRSPLLYDLTSLQRDANSRFGLSAQRTLAAAQRLYEGSAHGALITYPRTRSQFLPADQIGSLKGIAAGLAAIDQFATPARYVAGLDVLPLARVVNDAKVDDHHAIIPTGELPRGALTGDDRRVFELVARRFLAVFHPDARFEDTEVVTAAGGERFRTKGRRMLEAGWRGPAFGDEPEKPDTGADDDEREQQLPQIDQGENGTCESAEVAEKQTKPPARYSEASLLGAMETAGRTIDDEELRDAMKESGLGTPATRADTIERLLSVGYIERQGKALIATGKGRQTIGLLGSHQLTSAELTGRWEKRLAEIEHSKADRESFMSDISQFTVDTVEYFQSLTAENIGTCPNGDGEIRENRKAFGCSSFRSKKEPGCGFVIWKSQSGRTITAEHVRALLADGRAVVEEGVVLRLADGNVAELVSADGSPLPEATAVGSCPKCGQEIRENRRAYGCSSWKSREEPGCGFVIWKEQKGRLISRDEAAQLLEQGETDLLEGFKIRGHSTARLRLSDEHAVQIVGEDGTVLDRSAVAREAIAPCPKCDGEIRENSRAYGCSSWKSKKNPGCGFVIWKSTKGREITVEEARQVIESGHTDWMEFKDRKGPFRGRLVLQEDKTVAVQREDEGPAVETQAA